MTTQNQTPLLEIEDPDLLGHISEHTSNACDRKFVPCVHCGEETWSETFPSDEQVFCCQGCRGAHQLIHGLGLEDYYVLRKQRISESTTPSKSFSNHQAKYEQFDRAEFLGHSEPSEVEEGRLRSKLAIQGLHCAACSWLIENALQRQPGIISANVRMNDHTLHIVFETESHSA